MPSGSLQPGFSPETPARRLYIQCAFRCIFNLHGYKSTAYRGSRVTTLEVEAQKGLHARTASNVSPAASPLISRALLQAVRTVTAPRVRDSCSIHSYHADPDLVASFMGWSTEKSSIKKSAQLHPYVTQFRPYKAEPGWINSGWRHINSSELVPHSLGYTGEQRYLKQGKGFLMPSLISTSDC